MRPNFDWRRRRAVCDETPMRPGREAITPSHYQTLAALRRALRKFLRFSEEAARGAGIPPQQHQALLAIKGYPGKEPASIRGLAEYLQVKHHSAVGLVDRLAQRGLVRRRGSKKDRRRLELHVTVRGEALLRRLSVAHLAELRQMRPDIHRILELVDSA